MRTNKGLIVVLPCIHAPYTPSKVWEWAMTQLDEVAHTGRLTHVVVPGDWIDTEPASPHPNEGDHDQAGEYEVAARQAREIRKLAGTKAQLIRHDGNHEYRLEPAALNVPKRLRGMLHWTNHPSLFEEWRRWRWVPYVKSWRGCTRIGQVVVYHGFDCGVNSDELEGIEMAAACGGHPNLLMVRAHTHRPVPLTRAMRTKKVALPWWYLNPGHLGPSQPEYMRRKSTALWGQGVAVIEAQLGDAESLKGRCWDAEVRLFSEREAAPESGVHPLQIERERRLAAEDPYPERRAGDVARGRTNPLQMPAVQEGPARRRPRRRVTTPDYPRRKRAA